MLRCRADARKRFAAIRSDVLVKLELLDNKHVQDIVHQVGIYNILLFLTPYLQLRRLMSSLTTFHLDCHKLFDGVKLFPIEVELARTTFQYPQDSPWGQVGLLLLTYFQFSIFYFASGLH